MGSMHMRSQGFTLGYCLCLPPGGADHGWTTRTTQSCGIYFHRRKTVSQLTLCETPSLCFNRPLAEFSYPKMHAYRSIVIVLPHLAGARIEEAIGSSRKLHTRKRPLGLNHRGRADVLAATDHDEHERNDGKNGFGIEVWFHAPHSTSPARHPHFRKRLVSRD